MYDIIVYYETDSVFVDDLYVNTINCMGSNSVVNNIDMKYGRRYLEAGKNEEHFMLWTSKDIKDFQIATVFCGNGSLSISRIEIAESYATHTLRIFYLIVISVIVDLVILFLKRRRQKKINRKLVLVGMVLVGAAIFVSYPALSETTFHGDDIRFHLMRIEGIKDGLLDGQFPVKIQPTQMNGYGFAVSVLYGDLFLYIPAVLRIIGFSVQQSYNLFLLLLNLATAVVSYYSFKGIFKNEKCALFGAVLYLLLPYRLVNLYYRAAVGECLAMIFFPLLFYGIYRVLYGDTDEKGGIFMPKKKKVGKLTYKMLTMTILPLIILGIAILFFTSRWFRRAMDDEVRTELRSVAKAVLNTYDLLYPGDYGSLSDDLYVLTKGDYILNNASSPLDYIKETTGVDVTLFYGNTRFITTLLDDEGKRLMGTQANEIICREVLGEEKESFQVSVNAGGQEYFAYYCPIYNSDGSLTGMIATLKPSTEVLALIRRSMLPILILIAIETLLIGIITGRFTNGLIDAIHKQQNLLRHIAGGELDYTIGSDLLKRKDEFGDMARSSRIMQQSLRNLIEIDYLTTLENRRSGQNILKKVYAAAKEQGTEFAIAMGDIDHFKKFNDTYGHDCGDLVLQMVAREMKKGMFKKGYAVRWGGEEFLLIFDRATYEESLEIVQTIADRIRTNFVEYNNEKLSVTMTIGIIKGNSSYSIDELIKQSDDLLYEGKLGGRNRIVTQPERI